MRRQNSPHLDKASALVHGAQYFMEMAHGEGGVALYIVHVTVIAERWIVKHVHRVDSPVDLNLGVDQLLCQ
ncbi:hypothetical protein, partial [Thiolapillus sp.]|uniref:hypothetical protein n=1 Tax=Thiolapillus sp. TaxID=2017437 RepID=UPI003AF7AA3C